MFIQKLRSLLPTQSRKVGKLKISLLLGILVATIFTVSINTNNASAQTMLSNIFWFISPDDPYLQDWSDTVSISADDNWDNFIAVTGYRGDDLTTVAGTSPQTVLADGSLTPLDVIANQTNPNTLEEGGVAEFDGIANPTVALKGSDTADAPHLVIRINTKSCPETKFMTVSYKVRDLDGTANNEVQQVALHYRINDEGNYTNVASAFIADATEPNAATKVSTVFASLPQAVLQQDRLYLRIMTTNAGGNDEWVGIDDISVSCFLPTSARSLLSGKVLNANGSSMAGATVVLTDPAGFIRSTRTNSFGNYQFDNAAIGSIYVVEVKHKTHRYTPQIIIVSSDLSGIDFTPESGFDLRGTDKSPPK